MPKISETLRFMTSVFKLKRGNTKSENLKNALRESEAKYKALVENSQDGITIVRNNRFLFANKTYCNMVGYTTEELYNMQSSITTIHPDDHEIAYRIMERRRKMDFSTINQVFRFLTKSGDVRECETSSTLIEYQGEWASFFTSHDITESKRMQEELANSERRFRELVQKTNAIIVRWDNSGLITFVNEPGQKFFGYNAEELIGKPVFNNIFHSLIIDGEKGIIPNEVVANPESFEHFTDEYNRSGGEPSWISWNNTVMRDSRQHVIGISSIGIDISRRIRTEHELKLAKEHLETLNKDLESRIMESSKKLAETHTQLITLQKENLQSQFEVLRQQVNPHFLFNSLNVLTSLIKLDPDLAEQFSEQLSKVYRYVLENKDNELVSITTELRFLDAYIFLLNIRFVDKIKVNINISDEKHTGLVIPLAMQLLIENAIKHNIMTKTAPLVIDIFIDDQNYLNVINNLQERPSHIVSTGVGLKNIQNRYLLLDLRQPIFEKTGEKFIARVPLIEK